MVGLVSLWRIISRKETSYLLFAVLSVVGLVGAVTMRPVAYHSQYNRLVDYLKSENLYDGSTLTLPLKATDEQQHSLSAYISFFADKHGSGLVDLHPDLNDPSKLFEKLGVEQLYYSHKNTDRKWFHYRDDGAGLDIAGYSTMYPYISKYATALSGTIEIVHTSTEKPLTSFDTDNLLQQLTSGKTTEELDTPLILLNDSAKLIITHISLIRHNGGSWKIDDIGGTLLIK